MLLQHSLGVMGTALLIATLANYPKGRVEQRVQDGCSNGPIEADCPAQEPIEDSGWPSEGRKTFIFHVVALNTREAAAVLCHSWRRFAGDL